MDDVKKQSNNIVDISNRMGLVMPNNTRPPDTPLKNVKYEQLLYKIVSGMDKTDAYLALYHNCKQRSNALKGVLRILRRPEVKNRLKYLLANTYTRDNVVMDRKKSKNPESRDPEGRIDIKTRKGRLAVVELVIQDYLDGGSLRTEAVLKAVESLVKLHGDQEALERERGTVPVEKIIAHLLKCELNGIEPYNIDIERVPELVCKLFRVNYCLIINDGNTCMYGDQNEEAKNGNDKICDRTDVRNSKGADNSCFNGIRGSNSDDNIDTCVGADNIVDTTQPVDTEQVTPDIDINNDNTDNPRTVSTPENELQGTDRSKGIPTQGVEGNTAFKGRSGVENEDEGQPAQIDEYEGVHPIETEYKSVIPEEVKEEYDRWKMGGIK